MRELGGVGEDDFGFVLASVENLANAAHWCTMNTHLAAEPYAINSRAPLSRAGLFAYL
jgi:hypothetical protein